MMVNRYWLCGFQATIENFGTCATIVVIFSSVAGSLYLFIGTLSPNPIIATILSPITTVLFLMFGGFYITLDSIPVYYKWIYYISYFRYAYESLLANEFRGLEFDCKPEDPACIPTGAHLHLGLNRLHCCVSLIRPREPGEVQLDRLGMGDVDIWINVAILAGMAIGYRFLAYVCLRFLYKEKK